MMTDKELSKICRDIEEKLFSYNIGTIQQTVVLQALLSRRYSEIARLNLAEEGIPIEAER